jgi:N-carbamoyl-L-amino-acid hydrolase
MLSIKPIQSRIKRDIMKFAEFVDPEEEGFTRISFSHQNLKAVEHTTVLMEMEADLSIYIDAVGNLIGRREGRRPNAPSIMIGSHLDTVRAGGRFDGIAGVVAGLEVARILKEMDVMLEHPLEIVAFLAEEPSPFGLSTVGSRVMTGKLPPQIINELKDDQGRTLPQAIRQMGGDPSNLQQAKRSPADILAFLELHIEQGPSLEERNIPIGIVTGIVEITRGDIKVVGRNNHAGTTPMGIRHDALAAASEIVLALEATCKASAGIVGTIGKMDVFPNSLNVIPGLVNIGMELRCLDEEIIKEAIKKFKLDLENIQHSRGIEITCNTWTSSQKVIFDEALVALASATCDKLEIPYLLLPSGAGHDAGHLARITQAGMIFVPSKGGRSHCPEEWTDFDHIGRGAELLGSLVGEIDKRNVNERK